MEPYGTKASLYVPDPNFFAGEVFLVGPAGEPAELAPCDHPFSVMNSQDGQGNDRANYRCAGFADIAAAIAEDRPHRYSLELAAHAVEIMTAILHSAECRTWVEMTTTCTRLEPLTAAQAKALLE